MYADDDDIDQVIEEELARGWVDPPKSALPETYGLYFVSCVNGCGTVQLVDTEILSVDRAQNTATFRCRLCNDIQTAELLTVD